MAKRMVYTANAIGATFPGSVWLPQGVYIDNHSGAAKVDFLGYASAQAAAERKQPIGSHSYQVSGPAYLARFAEHLQPGGPNLLQLCYELAAQTLDTDPVTRQPSSKPDAVSFFQGAEDITVQ